MFNFLHNFHVLSLQRRIFHSYGIPYDQYAFTARWVKTTKPTRGFISIINEDLTRRRICSNTNIEYTSHPIYQVEIYPLLVYLTDRWIFINEEKGQGKPVNSSNTKRGLILRGNNYIQFNQENEKR